jgi:RNA polymerase sigma factor (sigma-70 family)
MSAHIERAGLVVGPHVTATQGLLGEEPLAVLITRSQAQDQTLVERHEAFGEVVRRFQDLAYGYAYALLGDAGLAQDAAQEAFITAYRMLAQLREPAAFPGWLRRIVRTHCTRLRRAQPQGTTPIEAVMALPSAGPDPLRTVERQEVQDAVTAAIAALPEPERVVTALFYIGGQPQSDIAGFLGVPLTTVKKRLQAARKRLQERMLEMVKDTLQEHTPSHDARFADAVQFFAAFETAAEDGEMLLVELLLMDGMDVDAPDREGRTLLAWAAQRGRLEEVELLLRHGAAINTRDRAGKTPLQRALSGGHRAVADLLRRSGATL